jgi:multiple RNA-binding domain-containing protein 1
MSNRSTDHTLPMKQQGIDLESFNLTSARVFSTLLLKNIPYGTSLATLTALFVPFGTPTRFLLPPAGTIAIVEMPDEASGKDAFRGLAYKKLGASVLYLEKAPKGIWNGVGVPTASTSTLSSSSSSSSSKIIQKEQEEEERTTEDEPGSTLFIKNLSFASTTASLTSLFKGMRSFSFARVQTKPDPKKIGATLSMGFGFVGFRTIEAARNARELQQGVELEGYKLEINFAGRGKEISGTTTRGGKNESTSGSKKGKGKGKEGTGTKLIVKNVPFEVTRREIRELFSCVLSFLLSFQFRG